MKNKIILGLAFLFIGEITFSQNLPFFKSYDWDSNPIYKEQRDEKEEMIAVKEKIVTEFYFEGKELYEYFLEHKILWLNSDDKIEEYNKVYLPFSSNSSLELNKARVITKEGKVINLDASKILTAEDEETKRKYKYFAFEGITKGSYIEYLYVEKKAPSYGGIRLSLQGSYKKEKITFDLFSPKHLIFKFKSLNMSTKIKKDTTTVDKRHWKLTVNNLDKLEKEYLSAYNAERASIIYKLDENTANKTTDISSYSKVSQRLYSFYYAELDKKTNRSLDKFVSELNLDTLEKEEDIVRKIDFFIKTNIFLSKASDSKLSDLKEVLHKKVMNIRGAVKLYTALLKKLTIKHELVLTSDRRKIKFDKEFEANNFLNDFLIYFPKTKKYLSPNKSDTRFGFPPSYNTDNYGLFIKEVKVGNFKSAVGKIKYIKPIKTDETFDKMFVDVTFNSENLSKNKIHFEREFNGYYAMSIQPFIHLVKGENKQKLIDGLAESVNKNIEVTNREIINDKPELFGVKPLKFIIDFTSEALVEKAGRKYLFKLGELIGKQQQLYQKKKRTLTLQERFQRSYYRKLRIKLPKGYKITNLKDINIDNSYLENGEEIFSFKSSFEIIGDVLTITANEHYRKNIVDVSLYEKYRKVINSAADFNKIVLLLEPK